MIARSVPPVAADFLHALEAGKALCVIPLPRVELGLEPLRVLENFQIYPRDEIDLQALNVVSYPLLEFERAEAARRKREKSGHKAFHIRGNALAWYQSGLTRISLEHFRRHALIAFPCDVTSEQLFAANHKQHIAMIRAASEYAERAIDLIRFEQCRLDLPDSLPGHAGTFDLASPYSAALFYFLSDNEAYIIAGQSVTHLIAVGIGLQLEAPPSIERIGNGEVGNLARRALAMFTEALESNSDTDKFVRSLSTLEFIAGGGEYVKMEGTKTAIAAHVAKTRGRYHEISQRFRELTSDKDPVTGDQKGIRTRIVHMGHRLESIVPDPAERQSLFRDLQGYIGKPIEDLIELSDGDWQSVVDFRQRRMREIGV